MFFHVARIPNDSQRVPGVMFGCRGCRGCLYSNSEEPRHHFESATLVQPEQPWPLIDRQPMQPFKPMQSLATHSRLKCQPMQPTQYPVHH